MDWIQEQKDRTARADDALGAAYGDEGAAEKAHRYYLAEAQVQATLALAAAIRVQT